MLYNGKAPFKDHIFMCNPSQWAYSTGQVPSHTFLLIGRFLQFCIRLVPEMKPYEIRKNGGGPSVTTGVTALVTSVHQLSRDLSAPVLLKLHYPAIHTNLI